MEGTRAGLVAGMEPVATGMPFQSFIDVNLYPGRGNATAIPRTTLATAFTGAPFQTAVAA